MDEYRHEIDGMRALAVIAVILFHAGFTSFSGGYVGVDVFFVISGYLITSIILADHERGIFSLIHFYERRARRILPALFVVLFSCLPFAYHYMLVDKLKTFSQGLISITLCSSNAFFWMKEDYFNSNTELNPLIHTWSLAIEEQFYIFYSLLFVLFPKNQHRLIILILVTTSTISLILMQWSGNLQLTPPFITEDVLWFSQRDWASFYLLTGRVWELLFGALAAFYLHYRKLRHSLRDETGALVGLILILFAIFRFNKDTPFPSFFTLIPTVGALLIILYGNQDTLVGRMLSMRVFTGIGLCSYSAYLWHQPLLAFARMSVIDNNLSLLALIGLVLLSWVLAYLCWRFVERPFRNKKNFLRRQILVYALSAGLMLDLIAVGILRMDSSGHWLHARKIDISKNIFEPENIAALTKESQPKNDYLLEITEPLTKLYTKERFLALSRIKSYKNSSNQKRLAVIGDSHAQDFVNMVAENNKLTNYQIRTYHIPPQCQMYIGNEPRDKFIQDEYKALCYQRNQLSQAKLLIDESDVIILASSWRKWAAERINGTIQALNLRRNQTILVVGGKAFSTSNPKLYVDQSYSYRLNLRSQIPNGYVEINTALIQNLSPTMFVDIQKLVCHGNNSCPVFTPDERLISFDGGHVTKSGAKYIGHIIFNRPPLSNL